MLPFENRSDDKQNSYFADGVQEEILTELSRVADLKVVSRSSVTHYKGGARNLRDIGRELGVAHVLEGSVQRDKNRVRVTAQLVDTRSDAHKWAERYDGTRRCFAIQSESLKPLSAAARQNSPGERAAIKNRPRLIWRLSSYIPARGLSIWTPRIKSGGQEAAGSGASARPGLNATKFLAAWCLLARVHGILLQGHDHTKAPRFGAGRAPAAQRLRPEPVKSTRLGDYYYHASEL